MLEMGMIMMMMTDRVDICDTRIGDTPTLGLGGVIGEYTLNRSGEGLQHLPH